MGSTRRRRARNGPTSSVTLEGNSLFRGGPDGRFTDVSVEAGVTMGRWAWASLFVDIDNDGFEDLVIANGNLTNDNPDDL